ncbi:hypothetical protein [Tenacibaculum agarivorans]|uniref:hypothetical protein n=1 Tax=Tenacibaculum agarivorans TaxID=1908389 RepID=UPI00094B8642|nr:hypothetical protein [Tenacibaculum agarivorans]
MKYQKSPFPYLAILFVIMAVSVCLKLTVDQKMKQPIVHEIKFEEKKNSRENFPRTEVTFLITSSNYYCEE